MSSPTSRGKEKSAASDLESSHQPQQQETDLDHDSTTTNESDDQRDGDGQLQKPKVLPQDRCFRESAVRLTKSKLPPKPNPTLREAAGFEIDAPIHPSAIDGTNASPEIYSEKNKPSQSESPKSPEMPKSKGKLGRIGGKTNPEKRRELKDKPISGRLPVLDDTSRATSVDTESKKKEQAPRETASAAVGRILTQPRASVTPRETSQERANNKREQLKRQLETKSNATVKKKRKF